MNISELINVTKSRRGFNAKDYVEKKIELINNFFNTNNLDAAVVGISGGVDSAVVLAFLVEASRRHGSYIKKVEALSIPITNVVGITNQSLSNYRAKAVCAAYDVKCKTIELSEIYNSIISICDEPHEERKAWAYGQMGSVLRTPILYYNAAILQSHGYRSIVVGTTNRDEGSYIGFFGKASDGMVDLQFIADLHKSEVLQVAEELRVPEVIVGSTPMGDVWDGRNDEEMIGAPYWFLELYTQLKQYEMTEFLSQLTGDEKRRVDDYVMNIERLHLQNKHKYQVGAPSHFLDVLDRKIPGGWN